MSMSNNQYLNTMIENIDDTIWFSKIDYYPKTVADIRLFFSIMDRFGVFDNLEIQKISKMNAKQLDLIYIITMINTKLFNKYSSHCTRKIVTKNIKKNMYSTDVNYSMLIDKICQDFDNFLCETVKSNYFWTNQYLVTSKIVHEFTKIIEDKFCSTIIKDLGFNTSKLLKNLGNGQIIANEILAYTNDQFLEVYNAINYFSSKIFNDDISNDTFEKIVKSLDKYINLNVLMEEQFMEVAIYCEEKFNDSIKNEITIKSKSKIHEMI
jgi:hypothetical protein